MPISSSSSTVGATAASTIVADAVTGSHVLTIDCYSLTKGMGNGECVSTGDFNVGGHDLLIKYYPNGLGPENTGWISIYLILAQTETKAIKARVRFSVSLLDRFGEAVSIYTKDTGVITGASSRWGVMRFMERKTLEESAYLRNDCFRISCEVTVIKEIRAEPTRQLVAVPPSDMHLHFGRLLSSEVGTDVTFQVGKETFSAHRYVLAARSSVFMAELFGPMKENIATFIRIDDMEASVFKAMLQFIYTDSLPVDNEGDTAAVMFQHLLVAADRYNLERLKLICEKKLCNFIDTSTAATTLALAEQHGCPGLKEACFNFFKSPGNTKAVMASDGFEHLSRSCPSILKELIAKIAP